jgi:hypothetical protein
MKLSTTYPNIVSLLHQLERQASLLICEAYPDLAVHEQTMVHINDILLDAIPAIVHLLVSSSPC